MTHKNFDSWNETKKSIHAGESPEFVNEREIWWCLIGINVGDEEDGKNNQFERPVLVIKKFNRQIVLAVSLTTKLKDNKYYFQFTHDGIQFAAMLSQIRLVSTKRFTRRIRKINQDLFTEIKKRFIEICL